MAKEQKMSEKSDVKSQTQMSETPPIKAETKFDVKTDIKPKDKPIVKKEVQKVISREVVSAAPKGITNIQNVSKQSIRIHLRPTKAGGFFVSAQDVNLKPGVLFKFQNSRLWEDQINTLRKNGHIKVISRS